MKVTDMMWPAPCGTFPGKAQSWKTALLSSQRMRNGLRQHLWGDKYLHGQIMLIWTSKFSFMTLESLHELPTFLNSPPGSIPLPFKSQIHRLSALHSSLCLEYSSQYLAIFLSPSFSLIITSSLVRCFHFLLHFFPLSNYTYVYLYFNFICFHVFFLPW